MSLNAQEVEIDLQQFFDGSLGELLSDDDVDGNRDLFTESPSPDGSETTLSVLNQLIDVDVPEDPGSLRFLITAASSTGGIDSNLTPPDNSAQFNLSGFGLGINSQNQRAMMGVNANNVDGSVPESQFRLDATHDEFLTIQFSQAVLISAIGLTDLSDGETFQFLSLIHI